MSQCFYCLLNSQRTRILVTTIQSERATNGIPLPIVIILLLSKPKGDSLVNISDRAVNSFNVEMVIVLTSYRRSPMGHHWDLENYAAVNGEMGKLGSNALVHFINDSLRKAFRLSGTFLGGMY